MSDAPPHEDPTVPEPAAQRDARRDVDRAALLGAALTAVVALTFGGSGAWDWLATAAGVALMCMLVAFFRFPHRDSRTRRREIVAFGAVAALSSTLVLAAPLQLLLTATATGRDCDVAGAYAAATTAVTPGAPDIAAAAATRLSGPTPAAVLTIAAQQEGEKVRDECLGLATNRVLWIPALVLGVVYVGAGLVLRRRPGPEPAGP